MVRPDLEFPKELKGDKPFLIGVPIDVVWKLTDASMAEEVRPSIDSRLARVSYRSKSRRGGRKSWGLLMTQSGNAPDNELKIQKTTTLYGLLTRAVTKL
jgi:hypothetical protein